jgi:hypothetical protein
MVSMITSSVVAHVLEHWSGKTKDYEIGFCFFSAMNAALRNKSRLLTSWHLEI